VTVHRNFTNAPVANTWYCQALANSLAGSDLSAAQPDISAQFNSNLNGSAGCLGGTGWYYGYDQNEGANIDFVSVVVHEIGHGLGFQTFVDLATGAKFGTPAANDTYMLNLYRNAAAPPDYPSMSNAQRVSASTADPNLRWIGPDVTAFHPTIPLSGGLSGGFVRVHAPNPAVPGSSVSHFSSAVSPNQIMEPAYTGANHNIDLTLQLMSDVGWGLISKCDPEITTTNDTDTLTVVQTATTWDLKVEVSNTGAFTAHNVSASMLGGPGWLSITDPTGLYPDLAGGASSFNTDTYTLDITNWPGGSFQLNLQIFWYDNCGTPYNIVVPVHLLPATQVSVAITSFKAAPRAGAVALSATFSSNLDVEKVNVYRGSGTGPLLLRTQVEAVEQERFEFVDQEVTPGATYRYQLGIVDPDGEFVSPVETVLVPRLTAALEQNHPNPFNPSTTIHFTLASRERAVVTIYNGEGRRVRSLLDEIRGAGDHAVQWDGRDDTGAAVTSGVYFYRLTAGKFSASRKMLLLK
jgi:hypothetical protein